MDSQIIRTAKAAAERAAREAGVIAKNKFDQFAELRWKDEHGDMVTEIDHLAEAVIISQIYDEARLKGSNLKKRRLANGRF